MAAVILGVERLRPHQPVISDREVLKGPADNWLALELSEVKFQTKLNLSRIGRESPNNTKLWSSGDTAWLS